MAREDDGPELRAQTVNQVGADMAVQVMLMMLFASLSRLADDPAAFREGIHSQLLEVADIVTLPPGVEHIEQDVRSAARSVISNVFKGAGAIQFGK